MSGLKVRGLTVLRGGRPILSDLSFDVPAGAWCGLIGVNGAGKTTLLKALAGRLPVEAGAVTLEGADVVDPRDRARRISLTTDTERLPDAPRALRLIAEVARAHGTEPRPAHLAGLWSALALDEISEQPIGVMSAGQRQRVSANLAFIGSPRLVLLDEPFNALDPLIAFDLKSALRDLARSGLTIVTAMHDLPTLALHCGHGLLLSRGHLAQAFDATALSEARQVPGAFEAEVLDRWRRAERR